MADAPWLIIIGLGEDGADGLSPASRAALEAADIIIGPPRHLALLPDISAEQIEWPVPFADGIEIVLRHRGNKVVVLASGDPFWFGAGTVLARHLARHEWHALPAPSTFSLAANRMGWALETTTCLGLHAAPLSRMRPDLTPGARLLVLLRDGSAVLDLGAYLIETGFGDSTVTVLEALGGSDERVTRAMAQDLKGPFNHPVCVAIEVAGALGLPRASGLPDDAFHTDGVMTKRPIRALTLSALAPRAGELLWDIGGGSGSIAVEWLLTHPTCQAISIEPRTDRAALIRANADALGVDRLQIIEGHAPEALQDLPHPDVVFVGGGLNAELLDHLYALPKGTRLVANAVTLDSEALLTQAHAAKGGELMRIDIARATPMGTKRGWTAAYPVVQWSVTL
ncbi:precorrin-6y C5,15-methyltransferase (decarboxylating) subunit CbiE [Gymnodinialimonas sp. 2305UL16-5]|uniref:precorrin-6y C5,15-methyltransferase (decarboxylating) subunit CbiE n=1 Tax=Gymnodinialimonas mytili TaxID=3126503 RepID=UPI0030A1FCAE